MKYLNITLLFLLSNMAIAHDGHEGAHSTWLHHTGNIVVFGLVLLAVSYFISMRSEANKAKSGDE